MPTYDEVVRNRDTYGRVIWLYGDSISQGYALGTFAPPADHPLYAVRSPASTYRAIAEENGIADVLVRVEWLIAADEQGQMSFRPNWIRRAIVSGAIRRGDVVLLEDAGPHTVEAMLYQVALDCLRAEATDRHEITCVMLTTPDYPPAPENSQWDRLLRDGRSVNEAIREAATLARPWRGRTVLLDMNAEMDRRRASALSQDGVDVMHPDGIHPNVWGQCLYVGQILRVTGLRSRVRTIATVEDVCAANDQLLAYGARAFTGQRAREYANWLLLE
ncbi:MAG: SGNH/GDSL hydrolase family protein [Chloroflexi bacterium]|nr:SGNH/GDSL hydrolase family protein [Chloroflexota bacterium]